MTFSLKQLEAFRALMIGGSATAAGELMGVTQPAVSRLIAQLEFGLKIRLFERIGGRLVATPEARSLYEDVEKIFIDLDRLDRQAKALGDARSGHLRVVAMPAVTLGFLPSAMSRFLKSRAEVTVSLAIRGSHLVADYISSHQADIGFAALPIDNPGVDIEPLTERPSVCVLPSGHRLTDATSVTVADLSKERFVSLAQDTISRYRIDKVFDDAEVPRRIIVETHHSAAACALVARGVGVSIVDPYTAESFLGQDVVLRPFEPQIGFRLGMLFPLHRPRSALTHQFVEEILALDS